MACDDAERRGHNNSVTTLDALTNREIMSLKIISRNALKHSGCGGGLGGSIGSSNSVLEKPASTAITYEYYSVGKRLDSCPKICWWEAPARPFWFCVWG